MSTDVQDACKAAYAKGYAAGRKKAELEVARCDAYLSERGRRYLVRRDQVFCAALQGLLSSTKGWTRDGHEVKDLPQHIDLALEFALTATTKLPD